MSAESVRLSRFLAEAGVASRRQAEALIVAGEISVNGRVVSEPGTRVDPDKDRVAVRGRRVTATAKVYYLVNKPKGVVASVDPDPRGRANLRSILPEALPAHTAVIGPLDLYVEGVVLVTNDGALVNGLTHPSRPVPKTYHVKLKHLLSDKDIDALREGVPLTDGRSAPAEVDRLRDVGRHSWVQITTEEGRHRIIHRMVEARGNEVLKMARVAFAGIAYFDVPVGGWRALHDQEVAALRTLAEASPPSRRRRHKV